MRTIATLLATTLALPAFADGHSSDQIVTIGTDTAALIGTLTKPQGDPAPVVLMLHGFSGSRDELKTDFVKEGVFAKTADDLAQAGFASLRIDFLGSGDSTANMTYAQSTFETQVADALASIRYLQSSDQVQGGEIHIIGWSQGGLVATAAAGRSNAADVVALWAAAADPKTTFSGLLGEEVMKKRHGRRTR